MISKIDNPKVRQFIQLNLNEIPANVAMQANKYPDLPIREIASQISSRQRVEKKLPEWYANDRLIFPPRENLEQASSQITATFKAQLCSGNSLVDLTGGTGIDAFYLSANFDELTIVEPNAKLCALLRHNFEVLGKKVKVIRATAEQFLKQNSEIFDCIYIDPSRRPDGVHRVYELGQYVPNVVEIFNKLTKYSKVILLKTSPMIDISQTLRELQGVHKVIALAVQNEMKEVLFICNNDVRDEPQLEAINIQGKETQFFSCTKSEEKLTKINYSPPRAYLYEPNVALRKVGAFNQVAEAYGVEKLHPQTHLYTSDELKPTFPGKIFTVIESIKPNKKLLKKRFKNGFVNIISKNYPLGANELKKKYGLNDGGSEFLIFCESVELGKTVLVGVIEN